MLTQEGCLSRRNRLWDAVSDSVEWILVADPRHVHYLANFWVNPLSFSAGERSMLLLERDGDTTLLADNFTFRSAASEPYIDKEVIEGWYDHRHSVINRDHALLNALKSVSERLFGRVGAIEAEWVPIDAWEALSLNLESQSVELEAGEVIDTPEEAEDDADIGSLIRKLRRQKEPDEIALLEQCMRACDAGHARAREVVHEGASEFEIYREVQSAALGVAGRPGLLYGDFRGVNAAAPKAGGLPTDYQLQQGDLFIMDYSVVLDGYRSDFTSTYAVGEPSSDQQKLFSLCEAAMNEGEACLRAGAKASEVYAAVSKPLEEGGYGALPHHAGHGIGLGHPESPIIVPESTDTLLAGDVVTLEPGLYVEGIGGMRIEHNYLVTENGYTRLSNHTISLT